MEKESFRTPLSLAEENPPSDIKARMEALPSEDHDESLGVTDVFTWGDISVSAAMIEMIDRDMGDLSKRLSPIMGRTYFIKEQLENNTIGFDDFARQNMDWEFYNLGQYTFQIPIEDLHPQMGEAPELAEAIHFFAGCLEELNNQGDFEELNTELNRLAEEYLEDSHWEQTKVKAAHTKQPFFRRVTSALLRKGTGSDSSEAPDETVNEPEEDDVEPLRRLCDTGDKIVISAERNLFALGVLVLSNLYHDSPKEVSRGRMRELNGIISEISNDLRQVEDWLVTHEKIRGAMPSIYKNIKTALRPYKKSHPNRSNASELLSHYNEHIEACEEFFTARDKILTEESDPEETQQPTLPEQQHEAAAHDLGYVRAALGRTAVELETIDKEWYISAKCLRKEGFSDFIGALVQGRAEEGIQLEGMPKDASRRITATLYALYKIATSEESIEAQAATLQHVVEAERSKQDLHDQLHTHTLELADYVGVNDLEERLTSHIDEDIRYITENIDEFKLLIASSKEWPRQHRFKFKKLEKLLVAAGYIQTEDSELMNEDEEELEQDPEIESDEPETDDSELHHFAISSEVAKQLDWVVLPPGASKEEVLQQMETGYTSEELAEIEWSRIEDLIDIANTFSGNLYRSASGTLGSRPPFFVAEIVYDDIRIAIAENPLKNNATYLVREDMTAGDWQEVLSLTRQEAREVGAKRVIHRAPRRHRAKILDAVQDILLPVQS